MRASIATKLMLGFLIVVMPEAIILGGVGYYSIHKLIIVNHQLEEISTSLEATRELNLAIAKLVTPVNEYTVYGDIRARGHFDRLIKTVDEKLNTCATAACHWTSKEPKKMAGHIILGVSNVKEAAQAFFGLKDPIRNRQGSTLIKEINDTLYIISAQLDRMSQALIGRVQLLQTQSHEMSRKALGYLFAFTLSVVALAVSVAYFISQRVSNPIRHLLKGTKQIIKGNLDYRVKVAERDEVGELAISFNSMIDELRRYREDVECYSRTLEEKVEERTEELRRKDENLRQSERLGSIGLLASGVAHEINTPLANILMNVNLLMEGLNENPNLYSELQKIDEDAMRCKRIIDDLLDFSRPRDLKKLPCNLNSLVERALSMVRHRLDSKRIVITKNLSNNLPHISCDPDQIQQVLINITINAVQAMPEDGILTVATHPNGNFVEVDIRDTGLGIPQGIRHRVFDPFFTTKKGGTGLGLSVSYRIIHDHGGKIEIESITTDELNLKAWVLSTGTTVKILLPVEGVANE